MVPTQTARVHRGWRSRCYGEVYGTVSTYLRLDLAQLPAQSQGPRKAIRLRARLASFLTCRVSHVLMLLAFKFTPVTRQIYT